tara:strand:+ start:46676 stop:49198 length:2523 start_codon:yes stop_codon:yes gene_type:complete
MLLSVEVLLNRRNDNTNCVKEYNFANKMKKQFLVFLLISCVQLVVNGQDRAEKSVSIAAPENPKTAVTGKIVNESKKSIPFVNVAVYRTDDKSLVGGTASDIDGNFSIDIRPGTYNFKFSFLSFQTLTKSRIVVERQGVNFGEIELVNEAKEIDEVEVVADRSQMELKLDKRVFNIEQNLANAGSNAAEILDNIPSVQVDVEGNISLRGSENVRVLIDGKPSTITGTSTADVLRQFQGSMIERVEVITNPSARYDAEGEVGIINIVLKKNKGKGINGGFEMVAGFPDNFRLAFNLNYRTEKWNLFTSYGLSYRDSPGGGSGYQEFKRNDSTISILKTENVRQRQSFGQNMRLGTDIFLNDYNTITISVLFNISDQENTAVLEYRDLNPQKELLQQSIREDIEDETGQNVEASFNYTKTFKEEDRNWSTDFQWSESNDLEASNIEEIFQPSGDLVTQVTSNLEVNRTILLQSDYVHPLKNDRIIEGGIRSTLRTIENEFSVEQDTNGGGFLIDPRFNNDFQFDENVYAGYFQFGNEIEKFSYQLGLRAEISNIKSDLKLTNQVFKQDYFNFFPSAFFTYKVDKTKQFQLSYSRRINRPNYRYLLPFQTFSDNRNFWQGNPNLVPEYTDSYEFGYLRYFKKGSFFTSLYYRHRTNVIERIVQANDDGTTIRFPINLSTEDNVGVELNGSYRFSKKVSLNANANFYRAQREGTFEGIKLENRVFTMNGQANLKAEVIKGLDVQANFRYKAPQNTTQGKSLSVYSLDLSAGKDVLQGKGTIVASVRDVFNSRRRRSITDTETIYNETDFQWRARQILLNFIYRINQKKKRGGGNRGDSGGSDDF